MATITAGLMIRRELRRYLQVQRIPFVEDKGWLDSQFTFGRVTERQARELFAWGQANGDTSQRLAR